MIYMSIPMPVLNTSNQFRYTVSLNIDQNDFPFVSKIVLSILVPISFHMNLKINLPISTKNLAQILKKIELKQ